MLPFKATTESEPILNRYVKNPLVTKCRLAKEGSAFEAYRKRAGYRPDWSQATAKDKMVE